MKRNRKMVAALLALAAVTLASCSKIREGNFTTSLPKGMYQALLGRKQGATEIRSADGTDKVNLTGTWVCKNGNYVFKMIFGEDGSFKYGCGRPGGPGQLSFGSGGGLVVNQEFNRWYYTGKYTTKGNVMMFTAEDKKDFSNSIPEVKIGETRNFLVTIVDSNELVITTSGTGSIRTYKRQ